MFESTIVCNTISMKNLSDSRSRVEKHCKQQVLGSEIWVVEFSSFYFARPKDLVLTRGGWKHKFARMRYAVRRQLIFQLVSQVGRVDSCTMNGSSRHVRSLLNYPQCDVRSGDVRVSF